MGPGMVITSIPPKTARNGGLWGRLMFCIAAMKNNLFSTLILHYLLEMYIKYRQV